MYIYHRIMHVGKLLSAVWTTFFLCHYQTYVSLVTSNNLMCLWYLLETSNFWNYLQFLIQFTSFAFLLGVFPFVFPSSFQQLHLMIIWNGFEYFSHDHIHERWTWNKFLEFSGNSYLFSVFFFLFSFCFPFQLSAVWWSVGSSPMITRSINPKPM